MIARRRSIIALLTALNFVNYVDRFVVNAAGPSIQLGLGLSDAQLGFVISAFMFGYFLTSPIFGWLGDRKPRRGLIAAGVAVWSLATLASGFAQSFAALVVARVAVGVGEASYATLAPTIIDDLSTANEKNRLLAIFYVAIPVGSALGYILGGFIDHLAGWRAVFFVASGPGLLLAALTLFIREPARTATTAPARSTMDAYRALFASPRYVATVAGYVAQTFAVGGFAVWAAPFLERKLCLSHDTGSIYFGFILVVTGIVGTAFGGWLADRLGGADRVRVALRVCAWTGVVATPLAALALRAQTPALFLAGIGLSELAIFAATSPTNSAILMSVDPSVRANAMAVSIFAIHALGDMISPTLIGIIADRLGDPKTICSGGHGLAIGMALLPVALALAAFFWFRGARPVAASAADER